MRLIFSRNRAAQLDLLLRSLERNAPPVESSWETGVIYRCEEGEHMAYNHVIHEHRNVTFWRERDFDSDLRAPLVFAPSDTVTFLCDDNVLYRQVPSLGENWLADEDILTFSLRLAYQGSGTWHWSDLPPHDHGYPGSIDGHTFRVADVLRMIEGQTIENPLMLETILAHRCDAWKHSRPLMAAYEEQALVGVPVNTVADDQRRPHGDVYPQTAAELNQFFLAGKRIDLDAAIGSLEMDPSTECLHEILFQWRQRVTA